MINFIKLIILFLIEKIELYEYRNLDLNQTDSDKKIIKSFSESNLCVLSDSGYVPCTDFHVTQPYKIYELYLENGMRLECADNHIVFTSNLEQVFVKDLQIGTFLFTDKGPSKLVRLYKKRFSVSMFDLTIGTPEHRYFTNGILSHNTVVAGIFLSWFLIFHYDKNIMIGANVGRTSKEILDKVKSIISYLPFWLKPGVFSWNAFSIMTDANSRILATTTTEKAAIGFSIHLLFLDEFAHVRQTIQRAYWDNIYPVMAADPNAKLIITSTPNGYELFQELYFNATEMPEGKRNGFKAISVPWWRVPGRDEKWAEQQIAILGIDAFNEQFACTFQRSDLLLLSPNELNLIKTHIQEFVHHEFDILDRYKLEYQNLVFRKDYEIENLKKDFLIFSIDLAEGLGKDYTVMSILKISPKIERGINISDNEVFELDKHFYLDQIGLFRSNTTSIEDFAKMTYLMFFSGKIINIDNIKVVLEWNTYGAYYNEKLRNVYGGDRYDESIYLKTYHRKGAKIKQIGLRQDKESKPRNCAELKTNISNETIVIHDKWSSSEFNFFNRTKNGSFQAANGSDDNVMTLVNVCEILKYPVYTDLVAECFENLPNEYKQEIDKLMNNGTSLDESTDFLADGSFTNGHYSEFGNSDSSESWF